MRVCDFQTSIGQLQRQTKQLRDKWSETKVQWKDKAARDFEQKYLDPLIPNLKLTLAAVYELAECVEDAEKECGDSGRTS